MRVLTVGVVIAMAGCQLISGIGDLEVVGTGGAGGAGGAGGCAAGGVSCYDGPPGTDGVGACKRGATACDGTCEGEVKPEPEDCVTPADEDCDGDAPACTGTLAWVTSFGGPLKDEAIGVEVDGAGNAFVTGSFQGTITFGMTKLVAKGTHDVFLAKLAPGGAVIWAKSFGGNVDQVAAAIAIDPEGDVAIGGSFAGSIDLGAGAIASAGKSDAFFASFTAAGALRFAGSYGTAADDTLAAIALDDRGFVYAGGAITTGADSDIWIEKHDPVGAMIWTKRWGDTAAQVLTSIAAPLFGGTRLAIGGYFTGTIDIQGGPKRVASDVDGFVAVLDQAGGGVFWWQQLTGTGTQEVTSVAYGRDRIVAAGTFDGAVIAGTITTPATSADDNFVVSLEPAKGDVAWIRGIAAQGPLRANAIAVDPAGNIAIGGRFVKGFTAEGHAPFAGGAVQGGFVLKLEGKGGNALWGDLLLGPGAATINGLAASNASSVFGAGSFTGSATFGGKSLSGPLSEAIVFSVLQ